MPVNVNHGTPGVLLFPEVIVSTARVMRPTGSVLRLALIPLALLAASAAHAAEAGLERHPGHRSFPVSVSAEGMEALLGAGMFSLPQFYAYDATGRQVMSQDGFEETSFREVLQQVLTDPVPTGSERTLAEETAVLVDAEGAPLADLPPADVTLVKLWADWCMPCHAQGAVMHAVLADFSDLRVNILEVEADPQKGGGLAAGGTPTKIALDVDDIDPEIAKKLRDPSLSQTQRQALLTKLLAEAGHEAEVGAVKTEPRMLDAEAVDPEIAAKLRDEDLDPAERQALLSELMRKAIEQEKARAAGEAAATEAEENGGR